MGRNASVAGGDSGAGRSLDDGGTHAAWQWGLEQNRLAILLAVLHRHGGLQMADQDVFVNVVGGVKGNRNQRRLSVTAGDGFQPA